ncbi:hypothetical protein H2198_009822 [Neophaeococcomyces mojaviensis]|uniref:Uncharacterized protein n=1 Tax=Neophaeococcomyces mojaviensis TaxID=3383035 RepID=A0ACC2ZTB1_9EURO|nr:hypothetical protein H2198_009822 [Knufia sp. JES_112]
MFFASPTSNITPPLVSVAMSRSDSRDSTTSSTSSMAFTSAPMQVSYSTSPSICRSSSSNSYMNMTSASTHRDSFSNGWLPSPYRSCMLHRSSSQGYDHTSSSSYISDDDLLALDSDLAMPPMEQANIQPPTSQPQPRKELTTEEQIAMLREQQEREQAQLQALQAQQKRTMQQRTVRFATDQRKPRRPSGPSQKRSGTARRS